MLKRLFYVAVTAAVAFSASGAPISPEAALGRLRSEGPARAKASSDLKLTHIAKTDKGVASAYVFVPSDGTGFTILSADDDAVPVLGYSSTGRFDNDNIPPALTWWLSELASRTTVAGGNAPENVKPYAPSDMTEIQPLLSTTWNQDAPYNLLAPMVQGVQAPTGCVATSVAQVMNYFEWPQTNKGIIQYYDGNTLRTLNLRKGGDFQWGEMLDSYTGNYTKEQGDAVAYLMQAAGYAVQMNYGAQMSGAASFRIVDAMKTYFGYDESISYEEREYFSPTEWVRKIYDNLKNVGPVIYDGSSIQGGHSFVCDGYDGNGYFHFNWGWGGMSDGYYVLDSLNPESQGIGGAEGGFNFSQGVIFGMQRPTGQAAPVSYDNLRIYGTIDGSISNGNIFMTPVESSNAGWSNANYRNIKCEVGAIICKADGSETVVTEVAGQLVEPGSTSGLSTVTLDAGQYYPARVRQLMINVPSGLPDGKYKVYCAARQSGAENAPWQKMVIAWGKCNFVYLNVEGGTYKVENAAVSSLDFVDVEITSPLYVGRNARIEYKVVNNNDIDLCYCFSPQLWIGDDVAYQGDMMLVTVPAHSEVQKESLVAFYAEQGSKTGEVTLKLLDRNTGGNIGTYGTYNMTYVTSSLKVNLEELSIDGAELKDVVSGTRTFNAYVADKASDFDIIFKYAVESGYLDSSVRLIASKYDPETNKFVNFPDNIYYSTPFLGEGQSADVVVPADFSKYDYSAVYRIVGSYMNMGSNATLGIIYVTFKTSSVSEIEDYDEEEVVYFNLQGVKVDSPSRGDMLIKKSGNKTSVIRF